VRSIGPLCVLTFLLGISAWAQDPTPVGRWTVVRCGTLLAVPGEDPLHNVTVVVKRGRIDQVLPGFVDPGTLAEAEGVKIDHVDLSQRFVLPGLIDAHTHITAQISADSRLRSVQLSDADAALQAVEFARKTLAAGFTTIRNLGSSGDAAFALRDAITRGIVPGPRILVAGEAVTPTGGHSDRTLGYREDLFAVPGPLQGVADGPDACRKTVRTQVKRGADLIKLTATGGVLSHTAAGTEQQFFNDELEAIVEAAHLLGRKVAAHAHGTRGINAALRAGVDSVEHGTFLDDESVRLFMERNAYLVPTIFAGDNVAKRAKVAGYFPPEIAEKALQVGPLMRESFKRALEGGVRIAFGTDSGVSPHGENAREFGYMVSAGMSEMDAIVSATRSAAELLGLAEEIGTIEVGKAADLVATAGNPLVDIGELERVVFVMRNGVIHKNE
jgi:imidazolonepropionase-like amidohydrolase